MLFHDGLHAGYRQSGERPNSPAETEYAWLEQMRAKAAALYAELLAGYPKLGVPDAVEDALTCLDEFGDMIGKQQSRIDGGDE